MANGVDGAVGILVNVDLDAVDTLKEIVKLKSEIAALKEEQKSLDTTTAEGAAQYEKLNAQIKANSTNVRTYEKNLQTTIKKQNTTTNSVAAMRQKVIDLKKVWAELDQSSPEFADATKELAEMTEKLKEAEASVGVYSRNVGNYGSAMQGVLPIGEQYVEIIQNLQSASKAAGGALKGMAVASGAFLKSALAIITTPLGATIAAIGATVALLSSRFGELKDRVNNVEDLSNAMQDQMVYTEAYQAQYDKLLDRQAEFWIGFQTTLSNTWTKMKVNLSKALGTALEFVGVSEKITSILKADVSIENMLEAKELQREINKRSQQLAKDRRKFVEDEAKIETDISELRTKSKEKEKYDNEERKGFVEQAMALNYKLGAARKKIAKEELAIWQLEMKKSRNSAEALDKEAELKANVIRVDKQVLDSERELIETFNETSNAIKAETKAQQEAILAVAKSTNDYYNDLRNNVTDMLTKTVSEQLDSVEKKYSDAIASMKKIEAPDPMGFATPEEYEQALDDYDEFRANQIVYTRRLEQQKAEEIEAINKSSLAKQIKAIEDSANDKYAADLIAFRNNEAEKLRVQEKILVETIAQKKAAGLDTYNEEAQLEALRVSLIESGLAQDLMSADRNAKERYDLKKAAYEEELALAEGNFDLTQEINEKIAQADRDLTEERIENASKYLNTASQLASSLSEIFSAQTEAAIESADEEFEGKQAALEEQHEAGLISDEEYNEQTLALEEEHNAEIAELERQQALRDRAMSIFQIGIDTAQGIMKAVVASPWTGGMPWAAIVAAMGAVQIATVLSQPLPKAATGGLIVGNSHANGGVAIEAEGGEVIINKKSASMFPTLLSEINEAGGGAAFASGNISDGGYALRRCARDSDSDEIVRAIKEMNLFVSVEEFNKKAERVKVVESRGTF